LPMGITLDPVTGAISGQPTVATAATDYTITASNDSGEVTTTLNLRTIDGWIVDSSDDVQDSNNGDGICKTAGNVCTLRAAVQEANAASSAKTIYIPKSFTVTMSFGSEYTLQNNMTIEGGSQTTSIINANGTSRHFGIYAGAVGK